ncbi:MAG: hypothetical protein ABW039_12085 [Sphingobium sp.]
MTMVANHPDIVGRYDIEGRTDFYLVKRTELDRSAFALARIIERFGIAAGRYILTVALSQEIVQFAPFEEACTMLGFIGTNADASPMDAGRVESICRQFDAAAVCGVDAAVLQGLDEAGHALGPIFAGRIIWARPDAYHRLAALEGATVLRCAKIGPALALECLEKGGLHLDGREWALSAPERTIRMTSRMARIHPLDDVDTGVAGTVDHSACACGSRDPRVILRD